MDAQEDIRALLESRYLALDPQEDIGILNVGRWMRRGISGFSTCAMMNDQLVYVLLHSTQKGISSP